MGTTTTSTTLTRVLIAALVAAALVLAYLAGTGRSDGGGDTDRRITVTGTGSTAVVPDEVSFDLTVTTRDPDLDTALEQGRTRMDAVVKGLIDSGVDEQDITSSRLDMRPTYRREKGTAPVPTGFAVTQSVEVSAPLEKAGVAVTAATKDAGRSIRVGSLRLGVSDAAEATRSARDEAVADSRAKAEQLAKATGRELGDPITIGEPQGRRDLGYPESFAAASLTSGDADTAKIYAGERELTAQVEVVWELR